MPACLRDTAGSARTTVLPATEPIVVTSSLSGSVWFAIGPRMNSRRATGAQPQNRHFVHAGSITRRHPPQIFCIFGLELLAATATTRSTSTAPPTMMPMSAPVLTSVDRLELEVGFAEPDHVVADQVMLGDLAVVDVTTIRRAV